MNRNYKILLSLSLIVSCVMLTGCSKDDVEGMPDEPNGPNIGLPGGSSGVDDSDTPNFNPVIEPWNGEKASDAGDDKVDKNNPDVYHEANSFKEKVLIKYNGSSATVTVNSGSKVKYRTDGAYVTIDMLSGSASDVEIIASGQSDDGSLKIYGDKKFKLTLDGVDLTSKKGPAINNQCKKRVYVHISDGTENKLIDCTSYSSDPYYLTSLGEANEDRKGCFFSEGHMIFSGLGVLEIAGKCKHGIATDGYMWIRPGVTIVISEAAKNAVHVKGDADEKLGFCMTGGLLYTHVSSLAGKSIKTDLHAVVSGGKLLLNQSGDSTYDESDKDTSSPAGIKTDGNITISGGTLIIKSTGSGGKGLNATGTLLISGGETTVTTTGATYFKSQDLTSSPKGVKADGDINITGGVLNIAVTGKADNYGSPEGLGSKSVLKIDDGTVFSYATDDAINATAGIEINGGKVYAHSTNSDGIDSNGYLYVNGGLVIANGASGAEESLDCENSSKFLINGGTIFGTGGNCMQAPSSSSKQRVVIYSSVSVSKNDKLSILDSSNKPLSTYQVPRGMTGMVLFISSSAIKSGEKYSISKNGTLADSKESWNGWYSGGSWTGGEQVGTFTPNGIITIVGKNAGGK